MESWLMPADILPRPEYSTEGVLTPVRNACAFHRGRTLLRHIDTPNMLIGITSIISKIS